MTVIYRGHQILLVHLLPSNKMVGHQIWLVQLPPMKLHVDYLIVLDFWFRLDYNRSYEKKRNYVDLELFRIVVL